ncbi:alpha/beta fold hydrolase [Chloroflexota bacterium]
MSNDIKTQHIRLKDGRTMGYAEYGDPDGKPAFYFHGFPGSRLDWAFSDPNNSAAKMNIRIIALDRPGMGLSDFQPARKILDWPDDVIEVANYLQFDKFAVIGISGGGPYAAACAFKIPERLSKTIIISGMGPSDAPQMKKGTSWTIPGKSFLSRKMLLMLFNMGLQKDPEKFVARSKVLFPEADRLILDKPEATQVYINMLREAFRSGTAGADYEARLFKGPWGFQLRDISGDVHLWHGELDLNVPVVVARYVSDNIPNSHLNILKDEAHLSLPYNHIEDILKVLA